MMRIERTLRDDLREKADYANTATQVTNRIVKECKEKAEAGEYSISVHIDTLVADEVLINLTNELTGLKVEVEKSFFTEDNSWYTISWED